MIREGKDMERSKYEQILGRALYLNFYNFSLIHQINAIGKKYLFSSLNLKLIRIYSSWICFSSYSPIEFNASEHARLKSDTDRKSN